MRWLTRSLLILLLVSLCVGCDQITKDAARQYLAFAPPQSWFHNVVRLEYVENTGAFLSLGNGFSREVRTILFQALPAFWFIALALYLFFANVSSRLTIVAWCLVLSGGLGNLFDRVLYDGRVIDFMNLGIGSFRTGIFNVADVCITIGASLLIVHAFQRPRVPVQG